MPDLQRTPASVSGSKVMLPALPKRMYVDAGHFEVERQRVLFRSWFCVGRLDDLGLDRPGRLHVIDVVGESILVTTDREGSLHGAYNVCRHRGSQVFPTTNDRPGGAACDVRALRCPYHSWTYDLDGRLVRAPHTEGVPDFRASEFSLHPVGVRSWAGFCFVHLTPDEASDFEADIAPVDDRLRRYPLGRLRTGLTLMYDVRANYKVLAENYNECYHYVEGWFAPMEDASADIGRWLLPMLGDLDD